MKQERALDQASIKRYNTARLLTALAHTQPISRKRLADMTDMSPASVTRLVGALQALGLVREVSLSEDGSRGRKAVNLHTVADGMLTVGVHIDMDCLRFILMDFDKQCRDELSLSIPDGERNPERLAALISDGVHTLTRRNKRVASAIGISVSGCVDDDGGIVLNSQVFHWTNAPLSDVLSCAVGLPVRVENDVKACLTWESALRGLDDGIRDAAYLYVGYGGVGFANAVRGRVVRGKNNSAGEIENLMLGMDDTLDQHLMASSLLSRAKSMSPSVERLEDIVEAYRLGLPWARLLLEDVRRHLAMVMGLIRGLLAPHCVILGGVVPEALTACPELLPEGDYVIGQHFERSCALGAAVIAMQSALEERIDEALTH